MKTPIHHLGPLLPHAGNMILLDEISEYSDKHLVGLAHIGPDHLFVDEQQTLPMWSGIEIMAQGVAALAGCHAQDVGQPVKLGFLLGSREVKILQPSVPVGSTLQVRVEASTRDEASGFGVFDCSLTLIEDGATTVNDQSAATGAEDTGAANATKASRPAATAADRAAAAGNDTINATVIATARLSVFSPPDVNQYIQELAV